MAKTLRGAGLAAAAYHAGLPAKHLQQVHRQFLSGAVTVVAATVAFGMGINKVPLSPPSLSLALSLSSPLRPLLSHSRSIHTCMPLDIGGTSPAG